MTTVGSAACTTDSWNASGFRTCNIAVAFTTFESDKASHVKIRASARHAAQRHIRDTPDTTRRSRARRDGMGSPIVSEEVRGYFAGLLKQVEATYAVARAARTRGFDPELDVEIPLTDDLASRVERLLEHYEVEGVPRRILELSKTHDREELAILVAKEMAVRPARSKEKAVERAVRVGLAILTEGILVAPLEGLAGVKIKRNRDGSSYVDLSYAGPIRSAGGTGQALSVLIADIVRRELGLGRYIPTREEVERFKEEIPLYRQAQHLQYTPSDEEISLIVSNCPVAIDGEGTEDAEISGHRDLPRLETDGPGSAGGGTPCDRVEGPLVVLDSGDFVEVTDAETAKRLTPRVRVIADLGEILVPFGEFLENNHVLMPGAFSLEWYAALLRSKLGDLPDGWEDVDGPQAVAWSRDLGIPLHPRHNLFFHDFTVEELTRLRELIAAQGRIEDGHLVVPGDEEPREWLVRLGATYRVQGDHVVMDRHTAALLAALGIEPGPAMRLAPAPPSTDPLTFVSELAGFPVKARGPTRIGARMARPEKSAPRKMQPAPHSLFPIGHEGGAQRLLLEAASKETIEVEVGLRICSSCGKRWFLPKCSCGGHTVSRNGPTRQRIPLADVLRTALDRTGESKPADINAVQGMISRTKTREPIEKGALRAKHDVYVFKDGTTRFDMTNLPLTHFTPHEVGISVETARRLGYTRDRSGRPLERDDQTVELRAQDIVVARSCGEYLVRVAGFVDDLLERLYGLGRFYGAKSPEDLLGHLVVTLAPHTSGGVLARIVGFTNANACFAHPYLIAATRRHCAGDGDSVILLLDCLVNFSRAFLPDKRGGLMDAPLVLTSRIDPNEIDKEAHNLDVMSAYPTSLYEAAERFAHPKEIEPQIDTVSKRIGSVLQYEGFAFTHETTDVAQGPLASAYGEGSMAEKIDKQLELALRIRAVDPNDVVARIVVHHFLPDLIGNLKAFSSQQVRCTKCGEKYRRIPLRGKCLACGGNLTLTVHESSVKKYLEISKRISQQFEVSNYLRQRIDLIEDAITSLFTNDKTQDLKLDDFF